MKKIKWENIITLLLGGAYIQHTMGLQQEIGYTIAQYLVIIVMMAIVHQMIKATRKGDTLKAIKEMFTE
jgi:hypothetical protein